MRSGAVGTGAVFGRGEFADGVGGGNFRGRGDDVVAQRGYA